MTDIKHYKIRYTYEDDVEPKERVRILGILMGHMAPRDKVQYVTCGIELKNKFGEPDNPHCHIFLSDGISESGMRKRYANFRKEIGEQRAGNRVYSIHEEDVIEDPIRFFRYAFKECGPGILAHLHKYPEGFDPAEQSRMAIDERNREIEKALATRQKERESRKNREKVFDHMEEKHQEKPYTDVMDIMTDIYQYYADNDKAANPSTILGLAYTIGMKFRVVTARQLAERTMR